MTAMKTLAAAVLAACVGTTALGNEPIFPGASRAPVSYAGQEQRTIKALAESEIASLLAGDGAGLAKAAELNGYPGPAHTLELANALALSPSQVDQSRELMRQHKIRARELGVRLVAAERDLNEVFASELATGDSVDAATREVGLLQASLRAEHLQTHLAQRALLTTDQTLKYAELRGYRSEATAAPANPEPASHGAGHH